MKKQVWVVATLFFSLGLTACSNGMNTQGANASGSTSLGQNNSQGSLNSISDEELVVLEKSVEESVTSAEDAIAQAEDALNGIFDKKGNLKSMSAESQEDGFQAQLLISGKIEEALDKVRVLLNKIPAAFDLARSKLSDAIAKLDANNPSHQLLIAKMMGLMTKIDQMEAKIGTLKKVLVKKINLVLKKLDAIIAGLNTNILGSILSFELQDVRQVIVDFRDDLK